MPSSVILAMQYEPRRYELLIVFRGGRGTYRYFDVPVEEWRAFRDADSKGSYLNEVFKRKEHPYERLAGPVPVVALRHEGLDEPLTWGETWSLRKGVKRVEESGSEKKIRA
jgi:hypothetical protein